jgi:hypothetical protein
LTFREDEKGVFTLKVPKLKGLGASFRLQDRSGKETNGIPTPTVT